MEYIIWKSLIYYRSMWLITFCRLKLSVIQRKKIKEIIADISYSCGATTDDLLLPETLAGMHGYLYIRTHDCSDPIEKNYFSANKDDPLCIHCGSTNLDNLTIPDEDCFYDMCLRLFLWYVMKTVFTEDWMKTVFILIVLTVLQWTQDIKTN